MGDLIAGLLGYFLRNISQGLEGWIKDFTAFGANDMGVWVGFVAIVMAAQAGKINLQDLTHILQQAESLINGGQAGGGIIGPNLFVNLLSAGVSCALGQDPQHS